MPRAGKLRYCCFADSRAIYAKPDKETDMKVEQILQSKGVEVFVVKPDDLIADAISMLSEKNIGAVIVKDDAEKVVGIFVGT